MNMTSRDIQSTARELCVVRSANELLFTSDDTSYVDLCMGFGTAWFGHGNAVISKAIAGQLGAHASPGYLDTDITLAALDALQGWFPETHEVVGLYTAGVDAIELALRMCCVATDRQDIAGFAGGAHGKSFVASALGHASALQDLPHIHRLSFLPERSEGQILDELAQLLRTRELAAVVIEPVQMSAGGYAGSEAFYRDVYDAAHAHGALVVFDELLTGFYRTGTPFYFSRLPLVPDICVVGKGIANGFPVAAVVTRKTPGLDLRKAGKWCTFHNHPLTAAAVVAASGLLRDLDPAKKVQELEAVVTDTIPASVRRGAGAMWCIQAPPGLTGEEFARRLLDQKLVVTYYGDFIRILPSLTMDKSVLAWACQVIRETHANSSR